MLGLHERGRKFQVFEQIRCHVSSSIEQMIYSWITRIRTLVAYSFACTIYTSFARAILSSMRFILLCCCLRSVNRIFLSEASFFLSCSVSSSSLVSTSFCFKVCLLWKINDNQICSQPFTGYGCLPDLGDHDYVMGIFSDYCTVCNS